MKSRAEQITEVLELQAKTTELEKILVGALSETNNDTVIIDKAYEIIAVGNQVRVHIYSFTEIVNVEQIFHIIDDKWENTIHMSVGIDREEDPFNLPELRLTFKTTI